MKYSRRKEIKRKNSIKYVHLNCQLNFRKNAFKNKKPFLISTKNLKQLKYVTEIRRKN